MSDDKRNCRISVIIPTYYRYECLERLLSGLADQSYPLFEVLVIDQTPLENRPERFYKKFERLPIKLINQANPSLTSSRNQGVREAAGELILLLDDDMVVTPDLVANHVEVYLEEHVDVVFGAVSDLETLPKTHVRNTKRLDPISFFLKSPRCEWSGMTLITSGANTLMRRELFLAVGGYDENMPRMEDIELGYRLYANGAKMFYSAKPFAQHKEWQTGGSRKSQSNLPYVRLLSKMYLYKKHFGGWTTKQFILHELCSAVLFREYVSGKFRPKLMLQPWSVFTRPLRVLQASWEAGRLLEKSNSLS